MPVTQNTNHILIHDIKDILTTIFDLRIRLVCSLFLLLKGGSLLPILAINFRNSAINFAIELLEMLESTVTELEPSQSPAYHRILVK